jgi:hypothetical protein
MISVLSIDGGGICSLIPALALRHLEEDPGEAGADLFDLIVGTSAGPPRRPPTYFEPAKVALGDRVRVLVDGGVCANNPAVSGYAEAEKRFPDEKIRLVSIGTGSSSEPISYDEAQDWGKFGWGLHLFDVVFDGNSDAADYQLRHVLGDRFERFQVPLDAASDALDDASPRNLKGLAADAERLIDVHEESLSALADRLSA